MVLTQSQNDKGRFGRRFWNSALLDRLGLGLIITVLAGFTLWASVLASQKADIQTATSFIATGSSDLTVELTGLDINSGIIDINLFNSELNYMAGVPVRKGKLSVNDGAARITFSDLKAGEYAFMLMHDANENHVLDSNLIGLPQEAYYFSNASAKWLQVPEWSKARFRLAEGSHRYTVALD